MDTIEQTWDRMHGRLTMKRVVEWDNLNLYLFLFIVTSNSSLSVCITVLYISVSDKYYSSSCYHLDMHGHWFRSIQIYIRRLG